MDIHHIHIYWTSVIYINYGHPHCGFQNIWFLSYMTDIYHIWRTLTLYDCHHHLLSNSNSDPYPLLSGPSLASKPLQEHKLIIMMELHHCWLSSTLLFIFQIKIYNCKIDTSHSKMELLEPSGKVWYRPLKSTWNLTRKLVKHYQFTILAFFGRFRTLNTNWKVEMITINAKSRLGLKFCQIPSLW